MGNCGKGIAAAFCLLLSVVSASAAECRDDQVLLRGDWGQARFTVELANDEAERNQGLMFRENLPKSAGMLFIYPKPDRVGFWMKNTLIPLDMIFLDETGTVSRLHSNAIPHDETPIMGGENILAVLEINGGMAEALGISEGTELQHPAFDPQKAAWPC
ncbi:DUF192 domain-containing protein [uncultured Roseovarius sp.]|uniref:DUF192 domain-containing protein n=1 Tax=uncultured Roseovarius sp. TaxID=293344 RepID=UPI002624923A|nr:DUF192 domain-containing protein [uncultured Roseovarius sp.]